MRTVSVLSNLAIVGSALALPTISTRDASDCGTTVSSNNNVDYFVECSMDSYSVAAIRETDTEIGLAGCLTACDGTVDCESVTFYPSTSAQTGTCQLYSTGATRLITNPDTQIAVRTSPVAARAASDCGSTVSSNNNIDYFVECSMDSYSSAAIKEADTEIGLTGCLTACDGTVDCESVTFYPSTSGSEIGTCQLYSTGATRLITNPDTEIAVRVTPTTTVLARVPDPSSSPLPPFAAMAVRSGSDFQYASINANSTHFWIGKGTQIYTPSSVKASPQNSTIFKIDEDSSALALHVAVPGGQQVYVDARGLLRFTVAHSADTGFQAKTTGFAVVNSGLEFEGDGFLACEAGEGAYAIYAASVAVPGGSSVCTGFDFRTLTATTGDVAYEYV